MNDDLEWEMNNAPCVECGCIGNNECGCECVDEENQCTLDESLVCPCCNKLGAQKNKERWPNNTQQPQH